MRPVPGLGNYQGQRIKKVGTVTISPGGSASVDLKDDVVAKELIFVCDLNATVGFSSGAPKFHPRGLMHGILRELRIERSANDPIKLFNGLAKIQDRMEWLFGEPAPALYKVNDTELDGSELVGLAQAGTTGQTTAVREVFAVPFENKLSSEYVRTCLNLVGITTGKINFTWGNAADIQDPEDATVLTSVSVSGTVTVYACTADHLGDVVFSDWIEYEDAVDFPVLQNGSYYEFKPQGMLQGVLLRAMKINSSGKEIPLNTKELKEFDMEVQYNGTYLFQGNLADFAAINGAKSSMRKLLRSGAYLNHLNNSTFDTGLETVQRETVNGSTVDSFRPLRVRLWTPSSINHSTTPVRLRVGYDLIKKR